jgi:hypothetical protein
LDRPFHLCRDEINGHTGFDQGFKTDIVFSGPFVVTVFGHGNSPCSFSPPAQRQHTALSKQLRRRKDRYRYPKASWGFASWRAVFRLLESGAVRGHREATLLPGGSGLRGGSGWRDGGDEGGLGDAGCRDGSGSRADMKLPLKRKATPANDHGFPFVHLKLRSASG